ncbi:translocation/assembly module TamB domain-containing protein [Nonlabens xiamenensis]|uniref:translocation/assembly module TamB domain-containing protein n=1 Tax=Nonlabens xiamenensis TaxID=2341043 RepID=UPI000F608D9A|nr:translocation/assembly module TamB [Nonlabens xiamenensis]
MLGLLVFLVLLVLFIRSPWGQGIIVDELVSYVKDKTGTEIEIDRLFVTFDGNVQLEGLYLEDLAGDTLVYSKRLEASIPFKTLLSTGEIDLQEIDWEGLTARVHRKDSIQGFNYQFLVDAFATAPDTTNQEPFQLSLGTVQLTDFDVSFRDEVQDLYADAVFSSFTLEMNELDLNQMIIDIDEVSLSNAVINYEKDTVTAFAKAEPDPTPETDTSIAEAITDQADDSPLPLIRVGNMSLDEVRLNYNSEPDQIVVNTNLQQLRMSMPKADLQNNIIEATYLHLNNSYVGITMEMPTATDTADDSSAPVFEWPDMQVNLGELLFENNSFDYSVNGAQPIKGYFNPEAISLTGLNVMATDYVMENQSMRVELAQLQGEEISGIRVRQFSTDALFTDDQLRLNQLKAQINNSSLRGNIQISYQGVNQLIENPQSIGISTTIPQFKIQLNDLFVFQPSLKENQYLNTLSSQPLQGNLIASGSTERLGVNQFELTWGQGTKITAIGELRALTDVDQLGFDLPNIEMTSTRSDIVNFVDEDQLSIELPQEFRLVGSVEGKLDDLTGKARLNTTQGDIGIQGTFKNQEQIAFNTTVTTSQVDLGQLLQNPSLGVIDAEIEASGSGSSISDLDAQIDGVVNQFSYNGYEIKELPIEAQFNNGNGQLSSRYKDDNLDAALEAKIRLDSINTYADAQLDVKGVNLQAFGISSRNIRAAGDLNLIFQGNTDRYNVTAEVKDGISVYDNQSYLLGDVDIKAYVQPDSTSVDLRNKMLDLDLRSNIEPVQLASALQRHVNSYLSDKARRDSTRSVRMKIHGNLRPAPILRDVILPNLVSLDTMRLAVDFDEKQRKLNADIIAPYIKYGESELDSLVIRSRSDEESLRFDIGFKHLLAGPLDVKQTQLDGKVAENQLFLDFNSYDDGERLIHFGSTLSRRSRTASGEQVGLDNPAPIEDLIFKLSVDDLILNKKVWTVPESNEMAYGEDRILFRDFILSHKDQSVELRTDLPNVPKDHLALLLNDFKLQALLSYFNPDEKLATGTVNGEFILEGVMDKLGFEADVQINDLHVMQVPLGKLNLDANLLNNDKYNMNLKLQGENTDLSLAGTYQADEVAAQLDLDLDIEKLGMETIAGLSQDFLKEGAGYVSGHLDVTGTSLEPQYDGSLKFNQAEINVAMLDTSFKMEDEEIKVNNEAILFDGFDISDVNNNQFSVTGEVGTKSYLNPTFDLQVRAEDFMALDSSEEDNDLYYGKAVFDAEAKITGDLNIPVIDLTLKVEDDTDFTYVIPTTQLDVVQRDGIVQFVNKENPDDILTQTEEESATLAGFDVTAALSIGEEAKINIIVDPKTGDQLQVSGTGDLRYKMYPNGRMTLTGRYEISDGFYELSLYEVVSRRFDLAKGGSVTWSGDPFDANLDVRAIYTVETSASALMAAQTSGADVSVKNKFRQELPFLVYLNVDGQLMQPEISFKLDLPEDEQGAIGGQVYGRIQQLNNQDQELNKQVFSLLVLNRFYPTSGADGSNGGTATIARDNLNQALSDQLNQFGGQLFGNTGVDLNFGLDSYTDYQGSSPQNRTQLDVTASKKLLDDRLIVSVGNEVDLEGSAPEGQQTPIIGNVSLEYLLTPKGQWRLKGFRRNQYDNVIDGQLIVSGISVIFTKEFNEFANLFKKTVADDKAKSR